MEALVRSEVDAIVEDHREYGNLDGLIYMMGMKRPGRRLLVDKVRATKVNDLTIAFIRLPSFSGCSMVHRQNRNRSIAKAFGTK